MAGVGRLFEERDTENARRPSRHAPAPGNSIGGLDVQRLRPQEIVALQRSTGNAAVTALLLQRDAGAPTVATPVQTPSPAPAAPADPAQDAKDLLADKLTTSKDYAAWFLKAREKGFVEFTTGLALKPEDQMEKLKDGKKVLAVDPNDTAVIPALLTMYDVVKGPISRWAAKPTDPKPVVKLGSFIRGPGQGKHTTGGAVDINEQNFTGNADQLITVLGDLSTGSYGLGIPFQGDFLPGERDFAAKEAEEKAKAEPATLTHMLKSGSSPSYTATWNKEKKKYALEEDDGDGVRASIKSATLKKKIKELEKAGFSFVIFADEPNHFHIDRR
jgi:hypothetical protein